MKIHDNMNDMLHQGRVTVTTSEKDWYYQVWEHCGNEKRVSVFDTFQTEWQARKCAEGMNSLVESDTAPDCMPHRFFFVRPIAAEDVLAKWREEILRRSKEGREFFMSQYRGEFLPYARRMVEAMLRSIKAMDSAKAFVLHEEGGWHVGYDEEYDGPTHIVCAAIYSGLKRISLEVAFVRGRDKSARMVAGFEDEDELMAWLSCTEVAAKACEERLIDICSNGLVPDASL